MDINLIHHKIQKYNTKLYYATNSERKIYYNQKLDYYNNLLGGAWYNPFSWGKKIVTPPEKPFVTLMIDSRSKYVDLYKLLHTKVLTYNNGLIDFFSSFISRRPDEQTKEYICTNKPHIINTTTSKFTDCENRLNEQNYDIIIYVDDNPELQEGDSIIADNKDKYCLYVYKLVENKLIKKPEDMCNQYNYTSVEPYKNINEYITNFQNDNNKRIIIFKLPSENGGLIKHEQCRKDIYNLLNKIYEIDKKKTVLIKFDFDCTLSYYHYFHLLYSDSITGKYMTKINEQLSDEKDDSDFVDISTIPPKSTPPKSIDKLTSSNLTLLLSRSIQSINDSNSPRMTKILENLDMFIFNGQLKTITDFLKSLLVFNNPQSIA